MKEEQNEPQHGPYIHTFEKIVRYYSRKGIEMVVKNGRKQYFWIFLCYSLKFLSSKRRVK
jgi:hypothetical protein